jgi:PAS domain S-box-containing protein
MAFAVLVAAVPAIAHDLAGGKFVVAVALGVEAVAALASLVLLRTGRVRSGAALLALSGLGLALALPIIEGGGIRDTSMLLVPAAIAVLAFALPRQWYWPFVAFCLAGIVGLYLIERVGWLVTQFPHVAPVEELIDILLLVTLAAVVIWFLTETRRRARNQAFRLATAVEQAAESVIITDSEGLIKYVNPAFEETSGYAQDEVLGRNPRIWQSGEHSAEYYETMWRTLASGQTWHGRFINTHRDGTQLIEDASIASIHNPEGNLLGYVALERDVTGQVATEHRLAQAEKLEAIGTLAGGVAHDFNNIMAGIMGFAELAQRQAEGSPRLQAHLAGVLTNAQRACDLVAQILAFSRRTEPGRRPPPVQLRAVAQHTLQLQRVSWPSTVQVETHWDGDPLVRADATKLHQVLMNLCANAAQALRSGGGTLQVSVRERNLSPDEAARLVTVKPGPHAELAVTDDGHGIAPVHLQRIFDPFYTTKPAGQGTGLGLAVAHGIVTQLGGAIDVQSTEGQGTTFRVLLPLAHEIPEEADHGAPPPGRESTVAATPDLRGEERLLFVDDEEALCQVAEEALSALGYRVTAFTNSRAALAHFGQEPADYDLVITDVNMPELTGDLLTREILNLRRDVPIILCTGYSDWLTEEDARRLGAAALVHKPLVGHQLARLVRRVLNNAPGRG